MLRPCGRSAEEVRSVLRETEVAKQAKKKSDDGGRNDVRPNGKAWKKGKHPEVREAELKAKQSKAASL